MVVSCLRLWNERHHGFTELFSLLQLATILVVCEKASVLFVVLNFLDVRDVGYVSQIFRPWLCLRLCLTRPEYGLLRHVPSIQRSINRKNILSKGHIKARDELDQLKKGERMNLSNRLSCILTTYCFLTIYFWHRLDF